eukprot:scaffold12826_cov86-Phaeocystis_antarctica.AAC.2
MRGCCPGSLPPHDAASGWPPGRPSPCWNARLRATRLAKRGAAQDLPSGLPIARCDASLLLVQLNARPGRANHCQTLRNVHLLHVSRLRMKRFIESVRCERLPRTMQSNIAARRAVPAPAGPFTTRRNEGEHGDAGVEPALRRSR